MPIILIKDKHFILFYFKNPAAKLLLFFIYVEKQAKYFPWSLVLSL